MTAQHTPGPWEWDTSPVDYDPEQAAPWLVSTATAKYPDCAILQGKIKCYSEANASLIAAAPELLEALIGLCEFSEAAGFPTTRARAAIAKATGGASLSLPSSGDGRDAEAVLTEIRTALNASGVWHLGMDTVDVIKSLIASRKAARPRYEPTAPEVVAYSATTGMSAIAALEALREERLRDLEDEDQMFEDREMGDS